MITFETFKKYIEAHKEVEEGEELIRQGLEKVGVVNNLYFDTQTEYFLGKLFEEAIGQSAYDLIGLWMWDYEMGTMCPPPPSDDDDYETLHSDIREFFEKDLVPLLEK